MLIKNDNQPEGLGYLLIDQTAAGIPVFGGNPKFEADTYTCTHCNYVVVMHPERTRERYKCRGCSHHICDNCAAKRFAGEACKTQQQKFEEEYEAVVKDIPIILKE